MPYTQPSIKVPFGVSVGEGVGVGAGVGEGVATGDSVGEAEAVSFSVAAFWLSAGVADGFVVSDSCADAVTAALSRPVPDGGGDFLPEHPHSISANANSKNMYFLVSFRQNKANSPMLRH
jgi:hypothetical protein